MQIGRHSDDYGFNENSGCSPQGGGFRGVINTESIVSVCCANHMGSRPQAASKPRLDWTLLKGESQLNGHDGAPGACTFFEAKVSPGEHQICCAGNSWTSGIFMAAAKPLVTTTTTTVTTTSATTTTTTDT